MLTTAIAAVGLFAGTNVDDIIVVTLFFLAVQRGALRTWQVVVGQYLGVGALIVLSLLAALGLTIIPDQWVGLLGLIPLGLGAWGFVKFLRSRNRDDDQPPAALNPGGLLGITGVTLANGADNLAVYTPLFRSMSTPDTITTVIVFVILIGVWILVGRLVGSRPRVLRVISRVETWLVPAVYCVLGLVILAESDVFTALLPR
ncbi:cadmium resistance transporter [Cellulomonas sp. C5510]|uniref:cadmium resistance transporter n=1 Tax=Cellulomonas sp. C5510 TaxID=2871170 RepID=UPI001C976FAB|nr:cadmium resistance transporter [Cellulomonas sp. C5510]QZN87467.1 cadmium resistance transporter [Cellulomonas sp. C5510]